MKKRKYKQNIYMNKKNKNTYKNTYKKKTVNKKSRKNKHSRKNNKSRKNKKFVKLNCSPENKEKNYTLKLGNLNASRDWGHARDYVEAMIKMMEQK